MARFSGQLPGSSFVNLIQPYVPPLNFIFAHYIYFLGTCILTSVIFYCTSTPAWSISYTDSLFLVISSMTEAGLNTVNLSTMNTFQQILLFMHILLGGGIFVSIFVVLIRKRAFEKRFGAVLKEQGRLRRQGTSIPTTPPSVRADYEPNQNLQPRQDNRSVYFDDLKIENIPSQAVTESEVIKGVALPIQGSPIGRYNTPLSNPEQSRADHITFDPKTSFRPGEITIRKRRNSPVFTFTGVGASPISMSFRRPGQSRPDEIESSKPDQSRVLQNSSESPWYRLNFLTSEVIGRNSQFHSLTLAEREQLGGVEYRAITLLSWIVPVYFVLWQFLGSLSLGAWMAYNAADITEMNGINPWWNGAFNAVSAFNNSGMSLLDANMIPFQTSTFPVFTMGLLILAGNTAYPVFLRLIIWTIYRCIPSTPHYQDWKAPLKFTLEHPRRVYTNLFPAAPTWWLLLTLITLNGTDWIAFELLNLGNTVISSIPGGSRALDGLFQAVAVRSGGFYIVPISSLRIGVQVLYVIMMYISVYPVVITMRNSNVYEERSLGIYADDPAEQKNDLEAGRIGRLKRTVTDLKTANQTRSYFIRQQVRGQLAHDLSWLTIAVLLIASIESGSFEDHPVTFSVFNVIFEVVSGYGCVGITTGLPDQAYSFSGAWHVVSKLILCLVMLRGRHRGLPVAIDRAVMLPGEKLASKEEEDHEIRRGRSLSRSMNRERVMIE